MAEFRTKKVLFHIVAQGGIYIDYEVGAETPEQAFRRVFTPAKHAHDALMMLGWEADDLDWVITCATEPVQECQHVYVFGSSVCSLCGDVLTIPCVENYVPLHPRSERSADNTTDPSIDPDGQTRPEVMVGRDRRVVNTPHRHPGPGDIPDLNEADDMARREQFQAEPVQVPDGDRSGTNEVPPGVAVLQTGWVKDDLLGVMVRNGPALHPGPGDTPDSHADEDMARREQFLAEQEELSQSLDQMLRGGRD